MDHVTLAYCDKIASLTYSPRRILQKQAACMKFYLGSAGTGQKKILFL